MSHIRWSRLVAATTATAAGLTLAVTTAPLTAMADPGDDLVVNGDFEEAVSPWAGRGGAQVARTTDEAATGSSSLLVSGRPSSVSGAIVSLPVEAGASYEISFQVKFADADATSPIRFNGTADYGSAQGGSQYVNLVSGQVTRDAWTEVTGEITVPSGRDLSGYQFYVENDFGVAEGAYPSSFYLDDVSFVQTTDGDGSEPEPVADPLERNDNTAPGSFGAFAKTPGTDAETRRGNPLVTQNFGADPWAMEVDGRVYVYTTNDTQEWVDHLQNGESNNYGRINQINVWSSADMMNWTNHGAINAAGPDGITAEAEGAPGNSWAPAAAAKDVDGDGEDEFFLYFANSAGGIWVLQGESPTGPFTSPLDRSLVGFDTPGVRDNSDPEANDTVWLFDPAVLVDDDGEAYLYFGGGLPQGESNFPNTARMAKLGDDMVSLADDDEDGETDEVQLIDAPAIFEDSGIHKVGDTYYYTYCTNFEHNLDSTEGREFGRGDIVVMESDSPLGPWSEPELAFPNQARFFGNGTGGNNHHAFFTFDDEWYLTYHAATLDVAIQDGAAAGYRNAHIDSVDLAEDGSVEPVTGTYAGPGQLAPLDVYAEPVLAETIAWQAGTRQGFDGSADWEQGTPRSVLTSVHDGDWTSLAGADLGQDGDSSLTARVLPRAGGTITVSTSPDASDTGAVVGQATVPAGEGEDWTDVEVDLTGTLAGTQDVFFRYAATDEPAEGERPQLFDVESWTFVADDGDTEPGETSVEVPDVRMRYGTATPVDVQVDGATEGRVTATVGSRTLRARVGEDGAASLRLPARFGAPGSYDLEVEYEGTEELAASSGSATVRVLKALSTTAVNAPEQVRRGRELVVRTRVRATGAPANGTVTVRVRGVGAKARTVRVRDGVAVVRVPVGAQAPTGRTEVVASYGGSRLVASSRDTEQVRVTR
ncbi:family 43 glycosylhydrolase [uncultured Nocardioides sp.]|uniref:family 43 glycosylhydrolase n=1 Tax=uncultured Nocardioides sp. TaxID=198441 RepID=UPI002606659F|nr:family 43 glycosylhydrolase [uncultured Nocardioides sp.]